MQFSIAKIAPEPIIQIYKNCVFHHRGGNLCAKKSGLIRSINPYGKEGRLCLSLLITRAVLARVATTSQKKIDSLKQNLNAKLVGMKIMQMW
jgi:hypothetical protein